MIVFHGTGRDHLSGLLETRPMTRPRYYLKGKKAFCTTTDFEIAALFAVRRSPISALHDESQLGVVLEYEIGSRSIEGKDWVYAKDPCLQDESEIAVLRPGRLRRLAVWSRSQGEWKRIADKPNAD